jgi:hypothetical protein
MTDATITGKTVDAHIENPDQASTNFYWSYETVNGVFNLQTTIRGILTPDQIKAHVKSALEANAHIVFLGGTARGKYESSQGATLPTPTPTDAIITETMNADPLWNQSTPAQATETNPNVFDTAKLLVTITNGKKYFKVKGGPWMKYGVTVWDEVLVQAGIPVGKLEGKEYDFINYKAAYSLRADGKPEKVIKLEKVA